MKNVLTFHFPPELTQLLIQAIPLLCRSKDDVLLFFRGAGVPDTMMADIRDIVRQDRSSISKSHIARTIISRINERGEACLRQRREVLKRVAEFDNFTSCWPDDQLRAKGLVAEIREVINVKDSFTKMKIERDAERQERIAKREAELESIQTKRASL